MAHFKIIFQDTTEEDAKIDLMEGGGITAQLKRSNQLVWVYTDKQSEFASQLKSKIEDGGVYTHLELSERAGSRIALYGDHLVISMKDNMAHAVGIEKALSDHKTNLVVKGVFDDAGETKLRDGVLGTVESVEIDDEPPVHWVD